MRNDQPMFYKGFRRPNSDFKAVQSQLQTEVLCYEVDLSVARSFTNLATPFAELTINGNSFYVDQNTDVGNATVIFEDRVTTANPIGVFAQPGSIFYVPFTRVKIANAAQTGKKLRIFYGVDIQFVPALTIAGTTNVNVTNATQAAPLPTYDGGFTYGASYKSNTNLAANTPDTIFLPGSNVNGAIVWSAQYAYITAAGAFNTAALLAKTSAPTSVIDGDPILIVDGGNIANSPLGTLPRPVKIPAGKGLYRLSTAAETGSLSSVLYTLL